MKKSESQVICGVSLDPQDDQRVLKLMVAAEKDPISDERYREIMFGYKTFAMQQSNRKKTHKTLMAV
jgi:hypothetical protein